MVRTKIFAWIAVLFMIGLQSAWADDYVKYSLTTTGDFDATVVRGGSFAKSGVNNSDDTNEPKRWTINTSTKNGYIQCVCSQVLAAGDVISITGTPRNKNKSGFYLRLEGSDSADAPATLEGTAKKEEQTTSYTVVADDGLIGQTTFYVMMQTSKYPWWINSIEVKTSNPVVSAVTISNAMQYSTYSNPTYNIDFTNSGAKAYIITGKSGDGNSLTFKQVYKVPYNTGVLIMADKNATVSPAATNDDTDDVAGNCLVADDGTKTAGENSYILTIQNNAAGFYKSSTSRTLSAGKAHLELPAGSSEAKGFVLSLDQLGETTGIALVSNCQASADSDTLYNMAGQRVGADYKGLVIKNGKKVIRR